MKYLKLFENFNEEDKGDIDEITLDLNNYGLYFKNVYTGRSIKVANKTDNFDGGDIYESTVVRFEVRDNLTLNDDFFKELYYVTEFIQNRFELKLVNIFTFEQGKGSEYYDSIENFKKDHLEKFRLFDLMFEVLH